MEGIMDNIFITERFIIDFREISCMTRLAEDDYFTIVLKSDTTIKVECKPNISLWEKYGDWCRKQNLGEKS